MNPTEAPPRVAEIDWLKGFAIICVMLIHSQPLVGTIIHDYVINRAVPIFIVLFGTTSELWWQRRAVASDRGIVRRWYTSRLWRLMVPVWGMLVVWWTAAFAFEPNVPFPYGLLASALGYIPWVGTGWFVTLILQLVVLFPLLHFAIQRLGGPIALALAFALFMWSHLHVFEICNWMRWLLRDSAPVAGFYVFYYFWIFVPERFFSVISGMLLARYIIDHRGLPESRAMAKSTLFFAGVLVLGWWVRAHVTNPFWQSGIQAMLDVPLTMLLLLAFRGWRVWSPGARALAWCGVSSWGLYLGQLLVHTIVKMLGFHSELQPVQVRWAYFAALLVGAVGWVVIGEAVRSVRVRDWVPYRPGTSLR